MNCEGHDNANADADQRVLRDDELDAVSGGGGVSHSDFVIHKLVDAATPKLYEV
jgi:type VI protein secretion system component Hcp